MNVLLAVLWKDLLSEWRRRDRVLAMLLFSLLVVAVFHFALVGVSDAQLRASVPGLLWIAFLFASVLGFNRAFALELENDALSGLALAPADPGWIFLGKATANFLLLVVVQAVTAAVFGVAFDLALAPIALRLAGIVALGSVGLTLVGTLFAAVAVRTRYREVMLPLLMLPVLMPVLIGAVQATAALFGGEGVAAGSLRLLLVFDLVYLIVSFLIFEYVLDE
ncbi:MAG: heme exporter protein CcmB [Deltaproteobacteria bacterium]|nr:MAG: heme exporter protein CcmB [Deltaproteobacteria bacterium]